MPSEMSALPVPEISLYTRPGCGLCEEARETLQGILEDRAARGEAIATINELDITADPDLEARFFDIIPVVEMGRRRLDLAISPAKLRRFVADALDAATDRIA
jgi:glutaredoxin